MNEVLRVIAERRSVRKYKPEQIKEEELKLILEAGLQAPSGHNDQPWFFTVIQNRELMNEINEESKAGMRNSSIDWMINMANNSLTDLMYGAPTLVVIAGRTDAISSFADQCAAIQNMLLAAESLGIGSCWLGLTNFYLKKRENLDKLGIPEGYEAYYCITLGYKAEGVSYTAPKRKNPDCIKIIK